MQPNDRARRPGAPLRRRLRALSAAVLLTVLLLQSSLLSAQPQAASLPGALVELRAGPPGQPSRIGPPPASSSRAAPASATFIITYSGFSAPAQAAFQAAVDIWATQITSPVPIRVRATWQPLGPGVLGSAGANNFFRDFAGAPRGGTWYPIALANKLAGQDLDPSDVDIIANFSSVFPNWYFGTDGNTPPGDYDLMTVVLHELGHGLGFAGSAEYNGGNGRWGFGTSFPFIYDRFVENSSAQAILNTSLFPNPSAALGGQFTSGNLFFNGSKAAAAAGGKPQLYAPGSWEQGSSFSHLDEDSFPAGDADSLMTPQLGQGEAILNPGAIVLGIFSDLGWATVSQPPPNLDPQMFLPITAN